MSEIRLPALARSKRLLTCHALAWPALGGSGPPPQTRGYSGAELAGVCREAALLAMEVDLNVAQVCEWR